MSSEVSTSARRRRVLIAVALVGFVVFVAALGTFWLTGGRSYVVRTPSMGTAAPVGTLILTRPTPVADLHVGEIVAYHPPGEPAVTYTHRIVAITDGFVHTRGDINGAVDPWPLTGRDIVGRAVAVVPRLGWLIRALPLLVIGNLVIFALTALWVRPARRGPVRQFGASILFAIEVYLLRPFVNMIQLETTTEPGGHAAITVVNTGLLPLRISPVSGHGHARPVDIAMGQVGVSRLHGGRPGHVFLLHASLHLSLLGWLVLALFWFSPLLWTLVVGYRPHVPSTEGTPGPLVAVPA